MAAGIEADNGRRGEKSQGCERVYFLLSHLLICQLAGGSSRVRANGTQKSS